MYSCFFVEQAVIAVPFKFLIFCDNKIFAGSIRVVRQCEISFGAVSQLKLKQIVIE